MKIGMKSITDVIGGKLISGQRYGFIVPCTDNAYTFIYNLTHSISKNNLPDTADDVILIHVCNDSYDRIRMQLRFMGEAVYMPIGNCEYTYIKTDNHSTDIIVSNISDLTICGHIKNISNEGKSVKCVISVTDRPTYMSDRQRDMSSDVFLGYEIPVITVGMFQYNIEYNLTPLYDDIIKKLYDYPFRITADEPYSIENICEIKPRRKDIILKTDFLNLDKMLDGGFKSGKFYGYAGTMGSFRIGIVTNLIDEVFKGITKPLTALIINNTAEPIVRTFIEIHGSAVVETKQFKHGMYTQITILGNTIIVCDDVASYNEIIRCLNAQGHDISFMICNFSDNMCVKHKYLEDLKAIAIDNNIPVIAMWGTSSSPSHEVRYIKKHLSDMFDKSWVSYVSDISSFNKVLHMNFMGNTIQLELNCIIDGKTDKMTYVFKRPILNIIEETVEMEYKEMNKNEPNFVTFPPQIEYEVIALHDCDNDINRMEGHSYIVHVDAHKTEDVQVSDAIKLAMVEILNSGLYGTGRTVKIYSAKPRITSMKIDEPKYTMMQCVWYKNDRVKIVRRRILVDYDRQTVNYIYRIKDLLTADEEDNIAEEELRLEKK